MLVCPISTETWGSNKVGRAMGARCWRGGGLDSGGERRARGRPSHQSGCSGSCVPVAIGEQAVAEDDAAASITLSLFGGDADDPNSALIFDRKAMPAALADGLPSAPLASASAEAPGARGVSPYDFFADVIDVPQSADARAFTAVSFFLFTPSLTSQLMLSNVLWASNDFFGPPSRDIASRLGFPRSALADSLTDGLTMLTRVTPRLSLRGYGAAFFGRVQALRASWGRVGLLVETTSFRLLIALFTPNRLDQRPAPPRPATQQRRTPAGLSKFVIADVTNPRAAPLELQALVPETMVPFQPIIEKGKSLSPCCKTCGSSIASGCSSRS